MHPKNTRNGPCPLPPHEMKTGCLHRRHLGSWPFLRPCSPRGEERKKGLDVEALFSISGFDGWGVWGLKVYVVGGLGVVLIEW